MNDNKEIKFKAIIEREIAIYNNKKIYAVSPLDKKDELKYTKYGNVSISGDIQELSIGVEYIIKGIENKYGYEIVNISREKPTTKSEIKKFLKEVITYKQTDTLLKVYPNIVDKIIKNDLDDIDLNKTKGIKEKTFNIIKTKVIENFCLLDFIKEFKDYNISISLARKLYKQFSSIERLKEKMEKDPYSTLCSIKGISFKKTDEIILSRKENSYLKNSITRIRACIKFCLNKNESDGNTWMSLQSLYDKCYKLVPESIDNILEGLKDDEIYANKNRQIAWNNTYKKEKYIAKKIYNALKINDKLIIDCSKYYRIGSNELTEEQKEVLTNFCKSKVSLLVGNAGSGKSFCTQSVINLCDDNNLSYTLMTPTGKSAIVLSEYTNRKAGTIHRMLEYNPVSGWGLNEDNILKKDVVIVDENGMTDISLMTHLLEAIDFNKTRILFVQDDAQLPSVGCGNCAYDLINSSIIPLTRLNQVFRYGEGGLLQVATKIRKGEKYLKQEKDEDGIQVLGSNGDYCLIPAEDEDIKDYVIGVYKKLLEQGNSPSDIMVLCAKNIDSNGTIELNNISQEEFNPYSDLKKEIKYGNTIFRENDLVIQIKNNYKAITDNGEETIITNGEVGTIISIQYNSILVQFNRNVIIYEKEDLNQLKLAYSISIHKCIPEDIYIYTNKGIKQIKDLNNGAKIGEFKSIKNNVLVYNGTELEKPKSFYNNGIDECKKITTKRKYQLEATLNHGIDILCEDGYIKKKEMKDIKMGDFILINKNNNIYGNNIILPNEWNNIKSDKRAIKYNIPKKMSKEFARFLGYMVADGVVCKSGIRLGKRHKEVVVDFIDVVKKIFGYQGKINFVIDSKTGKNGMYLTSINSTYIRDFCKNINGIQPNNKFVPNIILESPKEYQVQFLKSLFEDGTVNIKQKKFDHIELGFKDKKILNQIRIMLLNMGIITSYSKRIRGKKYIHHRVYIYKTEANIFKKEIGFISDFKNNRLELVNQNNSLSSNVTIPYIPIIIKKLKNKYNLKFNPIENQSFNRIFEKNRISYKKLKIFLKNYSYIMKNDSDYNYLEYISKNIYIDKITNLKRTKKQTYCLEMPKTHKFLQNGINAWNSQGGNCKNVILVMPSSHKFILNKNLMYVGVTRAKQKCYHIALPSTIHSALRKSAELQRDTFLKDLLINLNKNNLKSSNK